MTLLLKRLPAIGMVGLIVSSVLQQRSCFSAAPMTGEMIFQTKCASCHGADGRGVADGRKEPLGGELSLDDLIKLINETMPENDPAQCVGDEAKLVAEFVFNKFYSGSNPIAQPRVEMARLTVSQYRNAVADILGRFAPTTASPDTESQRRQRERPPEPPPRPRPPIPVGPGLHAQYFQSKGMSKADNLVIERVDEKLSFDFGDKSPGDGITPDQFSVVWEGGLFAQDTGYYEFRIATPNGARLYLNLDPQQGLRKLRDDSSSTGQRALIDQWVGSGQMREQTARVFMLGGRTYPLRMEFFKYLEKKASIELHWKPPYGAWSILDSNHTTTVRPARVFVCQTPFPADDRSHGFERGNAISAQWRDAVTSAAIETANEVVSRLAVLSKLNESQADRQLVVKKFVLEFVSAAYRRPLTKREADLFGTQLFEGESDIDLAVRRVVVASLMSPNFLYVSTPAANKKRAQFTTATKLSFALWDSIPDATLIQAADSGQLSSRVEIEEQAARMLADPRTKAKIRAFFSNWLELTERDIDKDRKLFPQFDERVIADLRRSLDLFVDTVVWSEHADYRQLLSADYLILNSSLQNLYSPSLHDRGITGPADTEQSSDLGGDRTRDAHFERVSFPPEQRAGILTHPYLLSALSYHNNSSPIHRGVFLTRSIVGRALNPPPQAIAFKDDEFAAHLTMREKITELTRQDSCMSCHAAINPLGFALENFDAIGRWRTQENSRPIDSTSQYVTETGATLVVSNARDVANHAIASPAAHQAFVSHMFEYVVKQSPIAFGSDTVEELATQFAKDNFNIRNLWLRIAVTSATHTSNDDKAPKKLRRTKTKVK